MSSIDLWYLKEVYIWRTIASITWHVLALPLVTVVYATLAQFSPLRPISWITGTFSAMASMYFVSSVAVIITAFATLDWFSASAYSVIPEVGDTRFRKLIWLLRPTKLIHLSVFVVVSFFVSWCSSLYAGHRFSGLVKYSVENSEAVYLNEAHVMFVLYGVYTGVYLCCQFYLSQLNYLQFPIVQREKFFQVRGELAAVFLRSVRQTWHQMRYFYVLYFILGGVPRGWILHNLNLMLSPESHPLDTLWGLLDGGLAWQLGLLGLYINYSMSLGVLLFRVYHTERFEFPVVSAFDNQKDKILTDAISCPTKPLLQYLGYLDLLHLAQFSPIRRQQVLTLSQPGGHPHIWNKLSSACLSDIDSFTSQVQESNWKAMAGASYKTAPIADSGDASSTLRMRSSVGVTPTPGHTDTNKAPATSTPWKEKITNFLAQKPVLSYFFSQLPDAKSRQLFATSQKSIWAVEALSYLVSSSYREDKFGIVQRSLPPILTSLLNLQENVEKHFKLNTSVSRRPQKDPLLPGDAPLRHQLQSALKTSIYRIINTFGTHLLDVPLPAESKKKLSPFIDYKE